MRPKSVKKKSKLGFKQENLDTYIQRAKFLKTISLGKTKKIKSKYPTLDLLKLADDYAYVTSGNLDRIVNNLLDPEYTKKLIPNDLTEIIIHKILSRTIISYATSLLCNEVAK